MDSSSANIAVTVACTGQTWLDRNKPVMLTHCLAGFPRKRMASAEKLGWVLNVLPMEAVS